MQQPLAIAVTTTSREVNYIDRLLASIHTRFGLTLVVCGVDDSYLHEYVGTPNVDVITATSEEWKHFVERNVHHRATWNYWRTLCLGSKSSEQSGLLIFEDDVILAKGWEERFYATLNQIEVDVGSSRFVLALYTAATLRPSGRGLYASYPSACFFGTQAMYYPEGIRRHFTEFIRFNGVDVYRLPYDLLLKDYLVNEHIPLFATIPSLAQHVGTVSTGLGSFHKAGQFRDVI